MGGAIPEERRLEIIDQVRTRPLVRADELALRFGVSVETIRRDLLTLEREGLVRRVYGGATRSAPEKYEPPFETRRTQHLDAKRAMGLLAASLVEPADTLVLDIGTSVAEVAKALAPDYRGKVLTNSLLAAVEIAGRDRIEVITSGGLLRSGDLACSGPHAEAFFSAYYVDKAFLGSGGVHPEIGLTDYHPAEVASRQIIVKHASEAYVMADSSKLGRVALAEVCALDTLTAVITDDHADPDLIGRFEEIGVTMLVAPTEQPAR
ncbi:MAG: DeoR/GlpR family DNA-binding transcription regulator [Acidimicrobiales bacterium]|jgi:DeoR family transcriptional regulator, fructose operon transcriptional repressor